MALVEQLKSNPWRFKAGDEAWIASHQQSCPVKVTEAFGYGPSGWPHYYVVDEEGAEFVVPQQLLSASPIPA